MTFDAVLEDFTRTIEEASTRLLSMPDTEPATLEHLMRDYVGHLKHHLRQILGEP